MYCNGVMWLCGAQLGRKGVSKLWVWGLCTWGLFLNGCNTGPYMVHVGTWYIALGREGVLRLTLGPWCVLSWCLDHLGRI